MALINHCVLWIRWCWYFICFAEQANVCEVFLNQPVKGNFTDFQPVTYHPNLSSMCKWTMFNFPPLYVDAAAHLLANVVSPSGLLLALGSCLEMQIILFVSTDTKSIEFILRERRFPLSIWATALALSLFLSDPERLPKFRSNSKKRQCRSNMSKDSVTASPNVFFFLMSKMFSETCFSVLFSSNKNSFVTRRTPYCFLF